MPLYRFRLVPLVVAPILLLTGAWSRRGEPPALAPAAPLAAAQEDPEGTRALDRAVVRLDAARTPWVRAAVWQEVACEDFTYQADGRLLAGPGHRLRLDLRVRLGRSRGEMHTVSDGTTLWESTRVDDGPRLTSRVDLQAVLRALSRPEVPSRVRVEFLQNQCFAGIAPLLQGLRSRMMVTAHETVLWNGREALRLTLAWPADLVPTVAPPGQPWPAYLPRRCFLYLDVRSSWPHRLECWGPGKQAGRDIPVFRMEFRDPVLNRPLSRAECAREFTFDAGSQEVPDYTEQAKQLVAEQARQQAAEAEPATP